jgi:hypothetical protein
VAEATALDPHTPGWELGHRYVYQLGFTTQVSFGAGAFDFDLGGQLELVPIKQTPDKTTLHASISDAKITSRIPGGQAELDRSAAEIRAGGAFFTLAGGRLSEFAVPVKQSALASSTYRQVAAALQFARALNGSQRYTAQEYDTTGQYLAQYEFLPATGTWQKSKQRYLGILGVEAMPKQANVQLLPQVVASQGEVKLAASGRPETILLLDRASVKAQAAILSSVRVDLKSTLDEVSRKPQPNLLALFTTYKRIGAGEPIGAPVASDSLDDARISGLDFDTILASLERTAQEQVAAGSNDAAPPEDQAEQDSKTKQSSRLFLALGALFRKQPATIAQAIAKIQAGSPAAPVLLDALSSAANSDAQDALVTLARAQGIDPKLRSRAVAGLARTPKPTREASAALKAILVDEPFNRGALYGLGTQSRHLRDAGDTRRAAELGDVLLAQLKRAKDAASLATVLRGIANSGYARALEPVTPLLSDPREQVRVAAVRALQSMHDPNVDRLLATRMQADSSSSVRISAIESAHIRDPSDVVASALVSTVSGASDPHVRYGALELLIQWLPQRSDLRPTLAKVAQADAEPRIRDRAKAAL